MLRPERMSRVSVTGSKRVIDDVIETVHGLRLLHVTEYDGSWDGFEPGDPQEGADEASAKLVTVRALKSTLGVTEDDAGPSNQIVTGEALEDQLEEIRQEVNDLDDRRDDLRGELRAVEEQINTMEPFVELGIDLDLLRGYDSLAVRVGEGDPETARTALADSDVGTYEVFAEGDTVAVFARTDEGTLQDALVNATFTALDVPEGDGDPSEYLGELRHRKQQLESKLSTVETELEEMRLDVGGFLLAAEEELTIEVQKREAPLTYATTDNAFVAEGWIPSEKVPEFESKLYDAVGDHIEISELEQAEYDDDGHVVDHSEVDQGGDPGGQPTAADGGDDEVAADGGERTSGSRVSSKPRSDGGTVTMGSDSPPVIQDNSGPVKPFEALVEVINRPKYSELDPTLILFLTFPAFFGFMIGDLGYGLLYMGLGYWMVQSFDSDIVKSLGGVGIWAGAFTAIFGVLYGEIFGLHQLGVIVWENGLGMSGPPIHKGLQPYYVYYAYAWLLVSAMAGILHLVIGRLFDFVNNLHHGVGTALLESGSWILMTVSLWVWVFTRTATAAKPDFMWEVFATEGANNPVTGELIEHVALPLGFNGFERVGLFTIPLGGFDLIVDPALLGTFLGLGLIVYAEGGIGLIESITETFGHVISYTRIAAVLLAKAGMALAVNLLVFGATLHDGEFHFIFFMDSAPNPEYVVFSGLVNGEGAAALIGGVIAGVLVLVLGHLLVLILGITSAGLQAVRLEYVEFFGKFYEGGGKAYLPFGHDREYTSD
ncbi:V-type ATP synthase subunit I [Salinibaculum rarum]|uniref:V-type ATP synthase subunit I n=1 Tax=Salinibaculum rarum TaxID=3058903 RepID=UPI00265D7CC8|nr:V-type ATPase 116kDa subunit family protein [Salinibaculum sp. KK48]